MFSPPKSKGGSSWTGGCGPGRGAGGPAIGRWVRPDRGSTAPGVGPGAGVPVVRTLRVAGAFPVPRGAAPRGPACPAGSPFLPRNGEKEGRGQAPWTPSFMAARSHSLVLGSLSLVGSRGYFLRYAKTDLGRIFEGKYAEKAFLRKKGSKSGHVDGCHNRPTTATPKAFPSGGRLWAGEAGSDEGATDWPNGAGEGRRWGDRSLLLQGKVGYRIAPSSVTFGDSFPPRGSLWVVQPYTKKHPKGTSEAPTRR